MAAPALKGGKPLSKTGYKIKWPIVAEADVNAATRVAKSGKWWRYDGREVENFEKEFAAYHDAKYVLGVSNGTVAIEVALRACGIEAGDEVIVPSVTFIASASAVLLVQGIPVFADILEDTCQIDPEDVRRKISPRTKAILVVHYGGYPVDMDAINDVAREHDLWVVEDSAHAQGSAWRGRRVGCIGDIGTFSFQQSKSLTCGEGGAVVTDSEELYSKAYAYHHIGRAPGSDKYEHTSVGPNYRLTEFQGAILRTQLKKLERQNVARRKSHAYLAKALADVPGLELLTFDDLGQWPEVEETGETLKENATMKARALCERFGVAALADDSGLMVDAIGGEPGVHSSRYAGPEGDPERNMDRLLAELDGVPEERRTARFVCVMALAPPGGETRLTRGTCEGLILAGRRGKGGFGYDPVFLPAGFERSMAQLSLQEKNAISHRGKALRAMKKVIIRGQTPFHD